MKYMTRNNNLRTALTVIFALAICSCVKDDTAVSDGDVLPEDRVQLTLYTNSSDYSKPVTRANESSIDPPMVLVFKGHTDGATFTEAVQSQTTAGVTTVTLMKTDAPSTILLIANPPQGKFRNGTSDLVFNSDNLTDALKSKMLTEVEDILKTVLLDTPQTSLPFDGDNLPMSGALKVNYIDDDTQIGQSGSKFQLTRAVAKAHVTFGSGVTGITIDGVGAVNAPTNGSLYRVSDDVVTVNSSNTTQYLTGGDVYAVPGGTPLYFYEADKDLGTAILVKFDNYYYKLGFTYEGEQLPIERNKRYNFIITSFETGYSSVADAIAGNEANIEYEIEITDGTAHEIVTNELFYLGLSNSEVVLCGNQSSITNAFTVSTDAAKHGITQGTITYTTGLSGPATFDTSSPQEIDVTMTTGTTSGTATVTVGGRLTLTVSFSRTGMMTPFGSDELPGDYLSGEITDAGTGGWLSLSGDGAASVDEITLTTPGKLYLMAEEMNVVMSGGAIREGGALYAVRRHTDGSQTRVKMLVDQDYLERDDIGKGYQFPNGYGYVGAFWRNEQTGERLIRIPYQSGIEGRWSAKVIEGADWIKMDLLPSQDYNVWGKGSGEPADMNDATNDATYQVAGDITSVRGILSAVDTDYIYFRIGLDSPLAASADPRYGLIVLGHSDGNNYSLIHIRHGHEPDYVMRRGTLDPGTNMPDRNLAAKFSPYNLTAEDYLPDMGNSSAEYIPVPLNGGQFTYYPTQAGAYFQWVNTTNERYAWSPYEQYISGWDDDTPPGYWSDNTNDYGSAHETCPTGYRRVNDGPTHTYVTDGEMSAAISELRQSLWLNPRDDRNNNVDNSLGGYYADGFFDRWPIVRPVGSGSIVDNTAVCINDNRVAYIGRLFFNANTNASLFLPITGFRAQSNGTLNRPGSTGGYHSATAYVDGNTTHSTWSYYHNITNALSSPQSRASGYSIRCVKDE